MKQKRQEGFALALTLFLLLILSTVCFGALSVATLDSRTTMEDYKSSRALYAARAGLSAAQAGVARARSVLNANDTFTSQAPLLEEGKERYSISVAPAPDNEDRDVMIWKVDSIGYYQDATRHITAYLELESFSKYAYFTNQDVSSSGTVINFTTRDCITGHVHTNGYFTLNGSPQFSNRVTSANYYESAARGANDSWFDRYEFCYYKNGRTSGLTYDPAEFYHSANNNYSLDFPRALNDSGDFSFAGGQTAIPLPTDPGDAVTESSKAGTSYTGNYRVIFEDSGSVKLYKRVETDAYGRQLRTPYYPEKPDETLDGNTDPGLTIYINGDVETQGKVKGRITLAAKGDITITGDIVYDNENFDVLGLLAEKNIIVATGRNSASSDRYIHAMLMALKGSFAVQNYSSSNIGRGGKLHVFGGIVQKTRGAVGTGTYNSISTGYDKDYVYDQKLQMRPPLNYPTTGRLVLRYFIDKGSLGGV